MPPECGHLKSTATGLPLFSINISLGFHLGISAGCLKLGPRKLSWGWWLMGLVPSVETFEVSIDVGHPGDCTGGMVFPIAPWKALGSPSPSMRVGMIPGADASQVLLEMTPSAGSHIWAVVGICVWSHCNRRD